MTSSPKEPASHPAVALTPPEPVKAIEPAEAERSVAIAPAAAHRIDSMVDAFVESAVGLDVHTEAYRRRVGELATLGDREVRTTSEISNRLLDRPTRALGLLGGGGSIGARLVDLRHTVEDLNPARYNLRGGRKLLGVIPLSSRLTQYFDRYAKAQKHINGIVGALEDGRAELDKDTAAISQEQKSLWTEMETLRQYAYMAGRLDTELESRLDAIEPEDSEKARVLREDMLFPIRQRRQEILTQLAVAAQGYAALRVVERNNHELGRAVRRATTTTVAALRTAVMVAQALADQRQVADQVRAVNQITSEMLEATSAVLRDQSADVEPLTTGTGVDMGSLQRAWDNVFAALDQIDAYKLNALAAMKTTVEDLSRQVARSRSYFERSSAAPSASSPGTDAPSLRLK